MTGFALVLLFAAAAAWIAANGARPRARAYLHLASALYGAMAVAQAADFAAAAVTDIAMTLGAVVLCIGAFSAFRRPPRIVTASFMLVGAGLCGIAAAMLGLAVLAAVPQVLAIVFTLLIARRGVFAFRRAGFYLAAAALSLLGAAACQIRQRVDPQMMTEAGLLLFAAAGVAGVALASNVLVENEGNKRRRVPVRRLG
jgi:hypothetical protein